MTACEHTHVTKEFPTTGGSARTSRRKRNRIRPPKITIGERVRSLTGLSPAPEWWMPSQPTTRSSGSGPTAAPAAKCFSKDREPSLDPMSHLRRTARRHQCDLRPRRSHRMVFEREEAQRFRLRQVCQDEAHRFRLEHSGRPPSASGPRCGPLSQDRRKPIGDPGQADSRWHPGQSRPAEIQGLHRTRRHKI